MRTTTTFLLTLFICISIGANAQFPVIPTSASTNMIPAFATILDRTIDGQGMMAWPSLTAMHLPTVPQNSVVFTSDTGQIDFVLGASYMINGISFWNQNNGGPSTDTGVDSVNFYYSTNGNMYTLIPGAPTNFLEVFTDTSGPETFAFSGIMASYIRMKIFSTHGSSFGGAGFAEIAFSSPAPLGLEESTLNKVKLYPNPAQESFYLEAIGKNREYVIYNIGGQEQQRGIVSEGELIQIGSLQSGLYFIQIDEKKRFKFIKK